MPNVGRDYEVPPLAGVTPAQHPLYDDAKAFASRIQSLTIYFNPHFDRALNLNHLFPLFPVGYCSIKHLSLTKLTPSSLPHLSTLLAGFAKTLEHLEIPTSNICIPFKPGKPYPIADLGVSV